MSVKDKSNWILLIFILAGLVIGCFIGDLSENVSGLNWLAYGKTFGLSDPVSLDLSVINITLGFMVKINMASIIGIVIAIFIFRKF